MRSVSESYAGFVLRYHARCHDTAMLTRCLSPEKSYWLCSATIVGSRDRGLYVRSEQLLLIIVLAYEKERQGSNLINSPFNWWWRR